MVRYAVPQSIPREDYVKMSEALGLVPADVQQIVFTSGRIVVTLIERNAQGLPVVEGDELVTSTLTIPIVD